MIMFIEQVPGVSNPGGNGVWSQIHMGPGPGDPLAHRNVKHFHVDK